ncbi:MULTISPECIES: sugar ABC transporter substrate-binding protein [unclassified Mesorhizobium]|uniref:sugar ABC transporter substrate-binding protein n=1 Tax=unclassified Mesorhizobium TaxID=325217 RepID=UPI002414E728|nr:MULTISPECIES: sugar ABC transporter substrate-binding protein [unclassified Mesorhizobium]MDG4889982.1 sugar ABC transporter substrate-binding protein [Mesorhizobium sp. WSM4887]MDG4904124.1 sugar ABC transporter substrate-binding protein [Mesorhizobium sp. WSM4962]MDG4909151.1 sugar ABC transporter substrate-binding protein [Mesorhizobium sp. WSM4898]MDG4921775.1 sugar ABC transporter substrate-binding protein [Mesorhizobium sp. WSM4989]
MKNQRDSRTSRVRSLLAVLPVVLTAAFSLTSTTSAANAEDKQLVFYEASHAWLGHPFWNVLNKGMHDAADKYGVKVVSLQENSPPNSAQQSEKIDRAIAAEPDGLIVSLPDAKGVQASLKRATEKGIPIIAMNVGDTRPVGERIPYLFYIGGDERLGGERAAEYILSHKKPTSGICVNTNAGQSGLVARCEGFTDTYNKAGLKADTIVVPPDSPTQAAEQFRAYLTANPDISSVFVVDPTYTIEIMKVLQEAGKIDSVTLFSYDMSNDVINAIEKGQILGTIDQQQYLQGYLAVEFLYLNKKYGFTLAQDVLTGPAIIDKDNVATVKANVAAGYR